MAKLLVIRCVVPPIVSTPATATTSQNSATSALWRSTKLVRDDIGDLLGRGHRRALRRAVPRLPFPAIPVVRLTVTLALPRREHGGGRVLPPGVRAGHPREDAEPVLTALRFVVDASGGLAARLAVIASARDTVLALVLTAVLCPGSLRRGASAQPGRDPSTATTIPHTPDAALLLVARGRVVLIWRQPVAGRGARCLDGRECSAYSAARLRQRRGPAAPAVRAVRGRRHSQRGRRRGRRDHAGRADGRHRDRKPVRPDRRRLLPHPGDGRGRPVRRHRGDATGGRSSRRSRRGPTTRPGAGSTRSGCGSPGNCTTSSPTPWPRSTCRPPRRRRC